MRAISLVFHEVKACERLLLPPTFGLRKRYGLAVCCFAPSRVDGVIAGTWKM